MRFIVSLVTAAALASAKNINSGSVQTYESFLYGKFSVRMKASDHRGTVSQFFTFSDWHDQFTEGISMNVSRFGGLSPITLDMVYGDKLNERHHLREDVPHINPHEDWHTYEFAWTPDYIAFMIDGIEVLHESILSSEAVHYLNKPQHLRLSFWTPEPEGSKNGHNTFDVSDLPIYNEYDSVEVSSWNSHTNGFDLLWRDDFNWFDEHRWAKVDRSWSTIDQGLGSQFVEGNAYTQHGKLVLKMDQGQDQRANMPDKRLLFLLDEDLDESMSGLSFSSSSSSYGSESSEGNGAEMYENQYWGQQ